MAELLDFSKVVFDKEPDTVDTPPTSAPDQGALDTDVTSNPGTPPVAPPAVPDVPDFDSVFTTKFGGRKFEEVAADLERVKETEKLLQDPFLKDFVDRYHKGEDLMPYVHARAVDYDKVDAQELAMLNLSRKYPNASKDILDKLYVDEFVKQYGLDDTENEVGRYRFETEMDRFRAELKSEQQKFLIPDQEQRQSPTREAEEKLKQELQAFYSMVDSDPNVQSVLAEKKIALKQGDESVFVGVADVDKLVKVTKSDADFYQLFQSSTGPDIAKFLRVAAYALDPEGFEKALFGYGKRTATESHITNLQNPGQLPNNPPQVAAGSLAEAVLKKLGGN